MSSHELDPLLLSLIDEFRRHDESIWDWHDDDGEICVLLIEAKKIAQAEAMQAIGLAGGEGRSLSFKRENGKYCFSHEARWIG